MKDITFTKKLLFIRNEIFINYILNVYRLDYKI